MMKPIFGDKFARISLQITFFLFFATLFFIGIFWQKLPPQVPLFYSHPWGEEQLAQNYYLFLFPFSVLLVTVVCLIISKFISNEKLLIQIFSITSTIFAVMAFYGLARIIFLVI